MRPPSEPKTVSEGLLGVPLLLEGSQYTDVLDRAGTFVQAAPLMVTLIDTCTITLTPPSVGFRMRGGLRSERQYREGRTRRCPV